MLLRSLRYLALVGAVVCGTGISQAQMMMQMNTPKFPMLASKPVQQELKLTDEQTKKIQAKIKELMPEGSIMSRPEVKGGGGAAAGGDAAPPQVTYGVVIQGKSAGGAAAPPVVLGSPNFKLGEGGQFTMPDFKKIDAEVDKLLEQPQRDRLKQLSLQRTGLTALAQEHVAKEVGLEDDQKELVKNIMEDQQKKTREFFQNMIGGGAGFSQDKAAEFMKKQKEQTESDLAIILSPDQKAKWDELLGPKFEFKAK